ncbi:MAG TPA: T9SS type A sorting domain-containing protein [Cyclobacteriaceae bacterium]|nr:T9SS type A sorting domain-containing protein [Cyclobacteriaceae bacterium]
MTIITVSCKTKITGGKRPTLWKSNFSKPRLIFSGRPMFRNLLLYLSLLLPLHAWSQFTYVSDQSIPVEVDGRQLALPWAGGLNSTQINTMDLDRDGDKDLVIFDRASNKVSTFLNSSGQYLYHPEYEALFPKAITRWMLIRDYNCDGLEDLFTANNNGISVFKNTTTAGGELSWEKLKFFAPPAPTAPPGTPGIFTEILLTQGFSKTNIFPGTNDIPNITDMDGDGDLDIVNMRFVNPFAAEFHQNMSMENYGTCDSLEYVRTSSRWGDWEECGCGEFGFGESCVVNGGRTNHNVGKSLLAIDATGDGNKDLLFSEEDCPFLFLLENDGTTSNPDFNSAAPFPQFTPAIMPAFPAAFYEDVNFDGKPDLVVSPAVYARTGLNNPFTNSVWLYRNTGSTAAPSFAFEKNNFLQDEMIEVGDYAYPAFVDFDGDGDQDMFIGNYGNQQFIGVITFFENVGTPSSPSFKKVTDDFLGLSALTQYSMKPQFIDINSDGKMDLAFTLADPTRFVSNLYYVPGNSSGTLDFSGQQVIYSGFNMAPNENLLLEDIDQDGRVDLLLGDATGALQYFRNTGNGSTLAFTLEDPEFMGIGQSITRTNLNTSVADLDNDGFADLIVGDQSGNITVYGDFRGTRSSPQPISNIIFDPFTDSYINRNLGARIKPVAVNLFNSDKPALAVGTVTGGMIILKNDGGQALPDEPEIVIYPNPLPREEKLNVKADRNVLMQVFTVMGQKLSEPIFVAGGQPRALEIRGMAPGIYIARFTIGNKTFGRKFVVH